MADFKKISDTEVVDALTDMDNVVVIGSDGVLKQTSSSNLGMDITKTEVVEAPAENDTLVLVSEGAVKQVSAAAFAAAVGGGAEPIRLITSVTADSASDGQCTLEDGSSVPSDLYDLFLAGTPIYLQYNNAWSLCILAVPNGSYGNNFMFMTPNGGFMYTLS